MRASLRARLSLALLLGLGLGLVGGGCTEVAGPADAGPAVDGAAPPDGGATAIRQVGGGALVGGSTAMKSGRFGVLISVGQGDGSAVQKTAKYQLRGGLVGAGQ